MVRRRVLAGVAVIGAVAAFAGCGGSSEESAGADGVETVPLGFSAQLSGDYQSYGIPSDRAMRLAVEQINEKGPFKVGDKEYRLAVEAEDDQSQPSQTTANAVSLVRDKGVKYVFGGIGKLSPLVLQVTDPANVIYFSASSAAAAKTGTEEGDYLFTTIPALSTRMEIAAESLFDNYPDARSVTLLGPSIVDNQTLFPAIEEALQKAQPGVAVDEVTFAPDTTDFSSILTSIKRSDPDVVFIGSTTPEQLAAILQSSESLDAVTAWYAWGQNCSNALRAKVTAPYVGNALVGADLDNPQTPEAKRFLADYDSFTGTKDHSNLFTATWIYDFVPMLVKAMEKAGTVDDTEKVAAALREVEHDGFVGHLTFDEKNQSVYGFDICKVVDGETTVKHYTPGG